jgi:hypothetical protein
MLGKPESPPQLPPADRPRLEITRDSSTDRATGDSKHHQ